MQTREITIGSPNGLHMRVAASIAKLSQDHETEIKLIDPDDREANGSSVLDMLTLGAQHGVTLRVILDGPQENLVARQLEDLLATPTPR